MDFQDEFEEFLKSFKDDLFDAFEEEFSEVVQEAMTEAVEQVVYQRYKPKRYTDRRRTKEGGLQNEKSITPTFERNGKEIVATVRNKATWRNETNRQEPLDEAIVEGTMFPKRHSNYGVLKRPFYDDPQDGVMKKISNSEGGLEKNIKDKMIAKGWGVK